VHQSLSLRKIIDPASQAPRLALARA